MSVHVYPSLELKTNLFCTTFPLHASRHTHTHTHPNPRKQINTENIEKCLLNIIFLENLFCLFVLETAGRTEVFGYITN